MPWRVPSRSKVLAQKVHAVDDDDASERFVAPRPHQRPALVLATKRSLAPPARVDLGLDHDVATQFLCDGSRLVAGMGDLAAGHRNVEVPEECLRLILVNVHVLSPENA